mmetsp:Transcript_19617/g.45670  ORF Transcript_19617/g.45670 Transcript_19617/m.45670 type:complete len:391 (-) Transcript_19617:8-1180(-)
MMISAVLDGGIAWLSLLLPVILAVVARQSLSGWALYSEDQISSANVRHPLFNTDEHYIEQYWQPHMTQRARLDSLSATVKAVTEMFDKLGVEVFLESASLIGWMRHNKTHVPWDSDADLGITVEECLRSGVTKSDLVAAMDESVEVVKFACSCMEDCAGDNLRMVGRFTNRNTGVCVDMFAYAPVKQTQPWQLEGANAKEEWWARVNDHADFTFPRSSLFPLRRDSWNGFPITIPQQPREFLSWEYGSCLEPHIWPWRMLVYTPATEGLQILCALKASMLAKVGARRGFLFAIVEAVVLGLTWGKLQNGVVPALVLVQSLCQLRWRYFLPELQSNAAVMFWLWWIIIVGICAYDLRGIFSALACQIDDYYIHPRRPKTWTLCLAGSCWDF